MKKLINQMLVPFRDQDYPRTSVYHIVMIVLFIGSLNRTESELLAENVHVIYRY